MDIQADTSKLTNSSSPPLTGNYNNNINNNLFMHYNFTPNKGMLNGVDQSLATKNVIIIIA